MDHTSRQHALILEIIQAGQKITKIRKIKIAQAKNRIRNMAAEQQMQTYIQRRTMYILRLDISILS
jgi:hypothetical protein